MAPGQRKSSTRAASAPVRRRASRAPSTSLSTMKSLKRDATMANPRPAADRAPSWVRRPGSVPAPSFTSLLMPSLIPSTFSLAQPYHFRRGADREALDDLEPVAGDAHDAARVVREQADALHAEVREHLRPEAEVAQARLARARGRGAGRLARVTLQPLELGEDAGAPVREDVEHDPLTRPLHDS